MDQFLWVEEYRPRDIESCVLPKTLKTSLQSFVDKETLPNLILSGGPGVGKTTAAKCHAGTDWCYLHVYQRF